MTDWYETCARMMRIEGVMEKGHLQINKNVIIELTDLHQRLLQIDPRAVLWSSLFKALPYIVELRARSGNAEAGEIEDMLQCPLWHTDVAVAEKKRSLPIPKRRCMPSLISRSSFRKIQAGESG